MAKNLSARASAQLLNSDIMSDFDFFIDGVKCADTITYQRDFSRDFGCATLSVVINNDSGKYSTGGSNEIKLRDTVELIERIAGATDTFSNFYGLVTQRNITKSGGQNNMTITCLDYIVKLQDTDIDKNYEANKFRVTNELLSPVFLPSPNDMYASIFNFANTNLSQDPPVTIRVRNIDTGNEDPQWQGFELNHEDGQLVLGAVLNARDNFSIYSDYYFYPKGLYVEDIIEDMLKQKDSYGSFLFNETTAQGVLDNHLTETFLNISGKTTDTLTPTSDFTTIDIETETTTACEAGDTTLDLDDISGWPSDDVDTLFAVNGDVASYTCISGSTLFGIPSTGSTALFAHPVGSYAVYSPAVAPNQLWNLSYDNLITNLSSGSDFTLPAGSEIEYIDKRNGRIMLDFPAASDSVITCNVDYSFKTLQSTGIEITGMKFTERQDATRFDAINKLRQLTPPNYLLRTVGDKKIWSTYLNQKTTADFDLKSITAINYGEDRDLYTRTVFYGENQNPHNVFFDTGVNFISSGETYTGSATNSELTYYTTEDGFRIYVTGLELGCLREPFGGIIVWIDGIPIDDNPHEIIMSQVMIKERVETYSNTFKDDSGNVVGTNISYGYFYKVYFSHKGLLPTEIIYIYDDTGTVLYTLGPNDTNINYEIGVWNVPGNTQNSTVLRCSSATYWVRYSTGDLIIDYDNLKFKINQTLIPAVNETIVTATFDYQTASTPIEAVGNCFDGRWDTQTQTTFFAKPPSGFVYGIVDLGAIRSIQLIDIIAGFYKPDEDGRRKFEMTNQITLKYSLDNESYYDIASETTYFALISGKTKTFDEQVLGEGFRARYFKLVIEDMQKIEYTEKGVYAISLVEFAAYNDVVLRGESKLIPTTALTSTYNGETTMSVLDTSAFTSGSGYAYLSSGSGLSTSLFWYGGKTATSFTNVTGAGIGTYGATTKIYNTIVGDSTLYDNDYLLADLGDVVYKNTDVNEFLDTQEKIDARAKDYLEEFVKNHTMLDVTLMYSPHIQIGHTVSLNDPYNNMNKNYFVERINSTNESITLTIARYP